MCIGGDDGGGDDREEGPLSIAGCDGTHIRVLRTPMRGLLTFVRHRCPALKYRTKSFMCAEDFCDATVV
jgi:hypothetical protein